MPEQQRTAAGIFGGNSDGGVRLYEWLEVMCRGCTHESVKRRNDGDGGGAGCGIADRACGDPYGAPVPEWAERGDGEPLPPHTAGDDGLDPRDPWPVCTSWEPRKTRADKGLRRGPQALAGQEALF